jgi:hypothetical protein
MYPGGTRLVHTQSFTPEDTSNLQVGDVLTRRSISETFAYRWSVVAGIGPKPIPFAFPQPNKPAVSGEYFADQVLIGRHVFETVERVTDVFPSGFVITDIIFEGTVEEWLNPNPYELQKPPCTLSVTFPGGFFNTGSTDGSTLFPSANCNAKLTRFINENGNNQTRYEEVPCSITVTIA